MIYFQSVQHEQLLRESNTLQNTIQELQNHNDVLQKAIQSHEESIEQLQQELSTSKFQVTVVISLIGVCAWACV